MIVRLLRQAFLLSYIFLTVCALLYTLGRKQIPHVPWPFVTHFYAMMAPFQSYTTHISMVMMYGLNPDGTWTKIDYEKYFPSGHGEYTIRIRLSSVSNKQQAYQQIAKHIFETENAAGAGFTAVRLQWEKWPTSQYGFYDNYKAGLVEKNFITEYPQP